MILHCDLITKSSNIFGLLEVDKLAAFDSLPSPFSRPSSSHDSDEAEVSSQTQSMYGMYDKLFTVRLSGHDVREIGIECNGIVVVYTVANPH